MSKGSKNRITNHDSYRDNYDNIFRTISIGHLCGDLGGCHSIAIGSGPVKKEKKEK